MKALYFLGAAALMLAQAHAQSTTSPAQMGMTPNGSLQTLQTLDNTKTWVPLGTVNPLQHTFSLNGSQAAGGGMTGLLTGNGAPNWTASFAPGGMCGQSNGGSPVFCGGTEARQFAVKNAYQLPGPSGPSTGEQLFVGNSYWADNPGPEGQQNAQILVLNGPEREGNAWLQDVNLGATGLPTYVGAAGATSYCPTDDPVCALAVSALQTINWQWDNNQNAVNVQTLVASSWWKPSSTIVCPGATPVYVWTKNNTLSDLYWYQTLLACDTGTPGQGTPQVRAFGVHTDQVLLHQTTPLQMQQIFAGEGPSGIFQGQLSHLRGAGNTPIIWNTGLPNLEWNSANYSGPICNAQTRVMGLAEATGSDGVLRIYMQACFQVFVRIDGSGAGCNADQVMVASVCQQRWQLYWTDPNPSELPANGGSMSGLRGLTAIPVENILLTGSEGSAPQNFYAIQPYPACVTSPATCYTAEYNVYSGTNAGTGGMTVGNTVAPYNSFPQVYDDQGHPHYVAPQSSYITAFTANMIPPFTFMFLSSGASGKKLAEAIYTFRNSAGRYNFVALPQLFAQPMNGIRDMVLSPFQDDCGYYGTNILTCAVYAAGGDMDGAGAYYWCKANPCPSSPPFVPTHNNGWVARGGFQNQ